MRPVKSVPVLTTQSKHTDAAGLPRSVSMLDASTDTLRYLMIDVPFVALPGLGSTLRSFSRDVSTSNLQSLSKDGDDLPLYLQTPRITSQLCIAVLAAMLSAFQYGYNTGVLNVPEALICQSLQLTQSQWSIIVSIFCLGGLFGSNLGGVFSDMFGRKAYILLNNALFITGALLEAAAANFWMLATGRFLIGLGCGGVTVVVPLYLGEISPAQMRGALGTLNQFSIVIGILVANILGKPLGSLPSQPAVVIAAPGAAPTGSSVTPETDNDWRYLVGLSVGPCIIQLLLGALMLESPLWLVVQNREIEAGQILAQLRGTDDVEFDIACLVTSREQDEATGLFALASRKYFTPLVVGILLQIIQQFSGINAIFFYSTSFFENAQVSDPWLGSVLAAAVNVLGVAIAIHFMDRLGRRVLLLSSAVGMVFSCVVLTVTLYLTQTAVANGESTTLLGYVSVGCVLWYVVFFEIGLGPIPWLIVAEIFPAEVRASAMSAAASVNWVANFAVGVAFPHINSTLGTWTFLPFAAVLCLSIPFTLRCVPETRGKSLEEIQEDIMGIRGFDNGFSSENEQSFEYPTNQNYNTFL